MCCMLDDFLCTHTIPHSRHGQLHWCHLQLPCWFSIMFSVSLVKLLRAWEDDITMRPQGLFIEIEIRNEKKNWPDAAVGHSLCCTVCSDCCFVYNVPLESMKTVSQSTTTPRESVRNRMFKGAKWKNIVFFSWSAIWIDFPPREFFRCWEVAALTAKLHTEAF